MKVYKKKDIQRLASELLVKDFNENKDYHFTNTSYGRAGDVLGTIEAVGNAEEHQIQYVLMEHSWRDNEVKLLRATTDKYYKTAERDYSNLSNEQVMRQFYSLSFYDNVYCEDKEYANKAAEVRSNRWHNKPYQPKDERKKVIKFGTPLYDRLYNWLCSQTDKKLKYGNQIETDIYYRSDYEYLDNYSRRIEGKRLILDVRIVYRGDYFDKVKYRSELIPNKKELN